MLHQKFIIFVQNFSLFTHLLGHVPSTSILRNITLMFRTLPSKICLKQVLNTTT